MDQVLIDEVEKDIRSEKERYAKDTYRYRLEKYEEAELNFLNAKKELEAVKALTVEEIWDKWSGRLDCKRR